MTGTECAKYCYCLLKLFESRVLFRKYFPNIRNIEYHNDRIRRLDSDDNNHIILSTRDRGTYVYNEYKNTHHNSNEDTYVNSIRSIAYRSGDEYNKGYDMTYARIEILSEEDIFQKSLVLNDMDLFVAEFYSTVKILNAPTFHLYIEQFKKFFNSNKEVFDELLGVFLNE